jgi:hypothetical protein
MNEQTFSSWHALVCDENDNNNEDEDEDDDEDGVCGVGNPL